MREERSDEESPLDVQISRSKVEILRFRWSLRMTYSAKSRCSTNVNALILLAKRVNYVSISIVFKNFISRIINRRLWIVARR